jgi:hypothetical protein
MNLINAFGLLDMINEGKADYLEKYKQYVLTHKKNVKLFSEWLQKRVPEVFEDVDLGHFKTLINEHDESKFGAEEFEPYANFWANDSDHYDYDPEYEAAWEHHWMTNEHHPEHWMGEDMPLIYILEMLCDWGSFSVAKNDFRELSNYYYEEAKDDDEKNLSDATKEIIEEILTKIDSVLDKEE